LKILQINTSVNASAPGRIASEIGKVLLENGHESIIAYGRDSREHFSSLIKIGDRKDFLMHVLYTRVFDRHGYGSKSSTQKAVDQIKKINPDLIHLHNIHGYYINIEILFNYLKESKKTVVWTLHDCWPFTGHCSYFDRASCERWQNECHNCPLKNGYPSSWILDNSRNNYRRKKELFTGIYDLTIVTPSEWLASHVRQSFLNEYPVRVINNGVDLNVFKPVDPSVAREKYGLSGKHIILGVANIWSRRKGFEDFIKLRTLLDPNIKIILVGLNNKQIHALPNGIQGLFRTEEVTDLAALYSAADVFVNPTLIDNFPTVNLESLACGTPVITYKTGGSPETIDNETGIVVPKGDLESLKTAILEMLKRRNKAILVSCRSRAESLFDSRLRYLDYLKLYEQLKCC